MNERHGVPAPLLELRDLHVAFGHKVVLRGITLEMSSCCLCIMGHAGAGKSTLLRTLAGLNDAQRELRTSGDVLYLGAPLGTGPRPWLVGQNARLLLSDVFENLAQALPRRDRLTPAEQRELITALLADALGEAAPPLSARVIGLPLDVQRCLAIAQGIAAESRLVMVDEPTAGLPDEGRLRVLDLLRRESARRGILLVTHNLGDARALGGDLVLLVDGHVAEAGPTAQVLSSPRTAAGRRFVETGTSYFEGEPGELDTLGEADLPAPPPAEGDGEPDPLAVPPIKASPAPPPRYLHWVIPGRLMGMARPGIVRDLDEDLATLKAQGVQVVITLEERPTIAAEALARFGMSGEHVPIEDMGAPSIEVARATCASIHAHLGEGRVVAVHCLGGMGRTGLILAAYFIFLGASAADALEAVRRVQPRFVQSDAQVEFLSSFELPCRGKVPPHGEASDVSGGRS